MRRFGLCALEAFAVVAMAGGCGGSQSIWNGAPAVPQNPQTIADYSGDLLYVTNYTSAAFFSFPEGKKIGMLPSSIGHPLNVCSDAAGNVWFPFNVGRNRYRLYEFAHGGTQPISIIDVPRHKNADACAVNSTNGDLAVLNSCCGTGNNSVLIWPGARSGKPKEYHSFYNPTACDYDDRGNLLLSGWVDSDGYFFEELKNGAGKLVNISLSKHSFTVGSVRWDGRYFAVAAEERRGLIIWRLQLSGTSAKIVETVRPKPFHYPGWFAVKGNTMVGTERSRNQTALGIWRYPTSGAPLRSFAALPHAAALAISVGS